MLEGAYFYAPFFFSENQILRMFYPDKKIGQAEAWLCDRDNETQIDQGTYFGRNIIWLGTIWTTLSFPFSKQPSTGKFPHNPFPKRVKDKI